MRSAVLLCLGLVASGRAGAESSGGRPGAARSPEARASAIRDHAAHALSRGEFARARTLYEMVSRLDRTDARAVREAGRAALALGDLGYAVTALAHADALADHAPDPELHYLRGEALYALARRDEARREHALAERDLARAPATRQSRLWLARVYARRGELARAERLYRSLAPPAGQPVDVEVAMHRAESHLLAHDGRGAQRIVRELLARVPDHGRARTLLAFALEVSGDLNDELAVREALAREATTSRPVFDYGRALERAGDHAAALRAYRRAHALAGAGERRDPELADALLRMRRRTSIELAVAAQARSDPNATALGARVGIAVPFGSAHHVALGAWQERLTARGSSRDGSAGELGAALALHTRRADLIAGGKLGLRALRALDGALDRSVSWSGFAKLRARPARYLALSLDAELDELWRETPRSLLEGGLATGATVHAYGIALGGRLIVDSGAQARRLSLPEQGDGAPRTSQLLGWTGLDVVLWSSFAHALDGEILDDNLLAPTYLADSVVAGYRHYELWSDSQAEFLQRMSMVGRASVEEATLTARKVVARDRLGAELRGALGWDHARDVAMSRVGVSLLATPTRSSRISLSFDLAAESPNGFRGQTRTGWVSYHADL